MLDEGVWAEVKVGNKELRSSSERNAQGVQMSVYNVNTKRWIAKICEKHHIPCPSVGHWIRVERGYDPEQTPLPNIEEPQLDVVNITIREKPIDLLGQNLEPQIQAMLVPAVIAVQSDRPISHPLVLRTKKVLAHPRKDERGLLIPKEGKPLSHIRVSESALPRSLGILDTLFRALDERKILIKWANSDAENLSVTVFDEGATFSISELL